MSTYSAHLNIIPLFSVTVYHCCCLTVCMSATCFTPLNESHTKCIIRQASIHKKLLVCLVILYVNPILPQIPAQDHTPSFRWHIRVLRSIIGVVSRLDHKRCAFYAYRTASLLPYVISFSNGRFVKSHTLVVLTVLSRRLNVVRTVRWIHQAVSDFAVTHTVHRKLVCPLPSVLTNPNLVSTFHLT